MEYITKSGKVTVNKAKDAHINGVPARFSGDRTVAISPEAYIVDIRLRKPTLYQEMRDGVRTTTKADGFFFHSIEAKSEAEALESIKKDLISLKGYGIPSIVLKILKEAANEI